MKTGLTYVSTMTVTESDTAAHLGSGDMPVLATPRLVALMENAAMLAVAGELQDGETTVGASIEVNHLAPSPVGAEVSAIAKLTETDGRKLRFEVSAYQGAEVIGRGTHLRVIVNREKFLSKL